VGIVFKNNAKTTLASNLSNSATSATVTDGSVFPSLSAGEFFLLTFDDGTNNEICKCTARSGNTLTIVRAQEGTTARAFSSGDAAEGRVTAGVLETIQENIAAKSANQTVYNATTASSATDYDIGIDPSVEANAMVFLNGVMQHHDTFSFSGSTLTFDAAPPNGMALEVIVDNLINLQSSNLTVDTFTATSGQTDFVLSDTPAAETNLIVFVDGVFQDQDSYTISNNTLTITDGVVLNRGVTVYVINPVNIGTPSDGTVTSSKLSGNITMPADLTVTGDVAFDSPTFVVDNANSRVGIGTASPSTLLDIVGDVKMSANLTVDTDTLHVDATNNRVGIGTTSPAYTLDVNSGTTNDTVRFKSSDDTVSIVLEDDDTLNEIESSATGIRFDLSGSERLRINASGSVTVNNSGTIPTGVLLGRQLVVGSSTGSEVIAFREDTSVAVGDKVGAFLIGNSDTDGAEDHFVGMWGKVSSTNGSQDLHFAAGRSGYEGDVPQMTLDSSGNVGIGTDSPARKLEIHNSATNAEGFRVLQTTAGRTSGGALGLFYDDQAGTTQTTLQVIQNGTGDIFQLFDGASQVLTVKDGGNVGIGTNNPTAPLHVDAAGMGDVYSGLIENTTTDTDHYNVVRFMQGASGSATGFVGTGGSATSNTAFRNTFVVGTQTSNDFVVATNDTERMRIDSSGNVGIGTDSPAQSLDTTGKIRIRDGGNTTIPSIQMGASGVDGLSLPSTNTVAFITNSAERMRIDAGGAMHIGTTAQPGGGWDTHLNVAHDTNAAYFRSTGSGGSAGVGIQVGTYTATTYALVFYNGQQGSAGGVSLANANASTSVTYNTSSDYRMKENIKPLENGLDRLKQLKPVKFDWKTNDETSEGFIAHEVQEIFPDAIAGEKDGEEMQGMDYGRITPLIVKAIQEQQELIETLKQEIREIREGG